MSDAILARAATTPRGASIRVRVLAIPGAAPAPPRAAQVDSLPFWVEGAVVGRVEAVATDVWETWPRARREAGWKPMEAAGCMLRFVDLRPDPAA